jgi:riboflavin synthase
MFTGLIEEIGEIKKISHEKTARRIRVSAKKIMSDLKIDDSVSLNGCCQTVVKFGDDWFEVVAIEETLRKTTLSEFKSGQKINLERAALPSTRLGGHMVQGHVDCVGKVSIIKKDGASTLLSISFPTEYNKYIVEHGSICIDGISLTVARLKKSELTVALIPHTSEVTTTSNFRVGTKVNLEFDVIAKYVESILKHS